MGITSGQSAGDLAKDHAATDVRDFVCAIDCGRWSGIEVDTGQHDGYSIGVG